MNQRIQELAEQAKKSVPHGLGVDKWIETYNEKFAELIIRECMDIATEQAEKTKRHIKSPGDRHESRVHGALDVLSAITKHFGVEE
jgi:hypothetical protein